MRPSVHGTADSAGEGGLSEPGTGDPVDEVALPAYGVRVLRLTGGPPHASRHSLATPMRESAMP